MNRERAKDMDFPSGTVIKNLSFNTRYLGLIPDQEGNNILHAAGQLNPREPRLQKPASFGPRATKRKKKKR